MKRTSLVVLAFVAASLALANAKPVHRTNDELLVAAMSARSSVSYTGVVQVLRIGNNASQAAVYRVEHRAPDLTRRVYTAPSSLSGETLLSNGDLSFSIDPKRRRIVETRNDAVEEAVALSANLALLRENYDVIEKGTETFDGRRTVDLVLTNKHSRHPTMLVRIDRDSNLVLDKEEFGEDGSLVSELRFEEIRYATAIPQTDFALPKSYTLVRGPSFGEPSENLAQVVRGAGFTAREPRALPDGFAPIEGNLVEMRGVLTLHLLYSDGIRTVSLFENSKASTLDFARLAPRELRVEGRDATYAEDGSTALLAWNDGALYYTLVGDLDLNEFERLAASIEKP
ncbi:MAG TPA: DUF4367 domain-containing protein [Candidatus Binatia bacterium]|nr:DUF4367 domain-containing protein [Candidatus Binatia bacterium]